VTLLLAVVGVGVVILGAVVLLLLPERPGGTIGWGGFQVNSRGAGLPLIVVGLVAIGFALKLRAESSTSTSPTSTTEPTVIYTAEFENQGRQAWTGGSYTDDGTYQLEAQRTDRPRVIASPPATAPTADNAGFSATARHAGGTAEEGYGQGTSAGRVTRTISTGSRSGRAPQRSKSALAGRLTRSLRLPQRPSAQLTWEMLSSNCMLFVRVSTEGALLSSNSG
jgi:hypothetical protein